MFKLENCYKASDIFDFRFYKLPKALFEDEKYNKSLSITSKIIYSILLDRTNLSQSNGWIDKTGNVYIMYTRENIMKKLNLSKATVVKSFKELANNDLIYEVKRKIGQANIIYVKKLNITEEYEDVDFEDLRDKVSKISSKIDSNIENLLDIIY